ncbi:MAG TPA: hypothetical protein PLN89_04890, partial [Elusimicrobiota bacterium]|nr:hypothetical protein [Elusimicrobiota bacterium]
MPQRIRVPTTFSCFLLEEITIESDFNVYTTQTLANQRTLQEIDPCGEFFPGVSLSYGESSRGGRFGGPAQGRPTRFR